MTTIIVTKNDQGKLGGLSEKDQKAYARFRKTIDALEPGEILTLDFWFPRNKKFHGLYFVMMTQLFDAQDQFEDLDTLRYWLTVGAGDCAFYPGPSGKMVAIPKSINWKSMDDEEFSDHFRRVKAFLRTPRATQFLWPHLTPADASEMVETILMGFDQA